MTKLINSQDFPALFNRMHEEFPSSEMKSLDEFISLLNEGKYFCIGYYDNNQLIGFALGLLTSEKFFWLDYLQIFKEHQNGGYGSLLLKEILTNYATSGILLETEVLDNDDYNDIKNRRMRFYDRFNIHQVNCHYLFPCSDGSYIDTLNLQYIPSFDRDFVKQEEFKTAIREAVGTIHKALPHANGLMEKYIDEIKDLSIQRFSLEDMDISNEDDIKAVGRLIYYTDPYVYPALFDNNIELSIKCAEGLLTKDTLFNYKNIKVGKINGQVAGFMVILKEFPKNNYEQMKAAVKESLSYLTEKFEHVMEGYFNTLDYEWEGIQIMSLAVLPEFRRMRVGSKMLNSLQSKSTYSLACVKDNLAARKMYEKCGFKFKFEYPGYTGIMCVELVRKGK